MSYAYDANGNLTSGNGRGYTWDAENRPTLIGGGGIVDENYTYDADSRRVKITTSQATTLYLEGMWDENVGTGAVKQHYLLDGKVVAVRRTAGGTSTLTYLHGDPLGSISVATATGGAVVSQQEFDPWGKLRSGDIPETNRDYTGQLRDGTGLLYYNARYYDPGIGRFISADTVVPGTASGGMDGLAGRPLTVDFHETGFLGKLNQENKLGFWFQLNDKEKEQAGSPWGPANPQALNRYSYVQNNPLRYTDPTGHWTFSLGISISGGGFLGGSYSGGIIFDGQNGVQMYESTAFGGMVGGGLGLTISATATREETMAQTEGAGVNVGVALPAGPIAGVDLPLSTPESSYKGLDRIRGVSVSSGLALGMDVHMQRTNTTLRPVPNPMASARRFVADIERMIIDRARPQNIPR